jgi:two-component system cell cycle response regulator
MSISSASLFALMLRDLVFTFFLYRRHLCSRQYKLCRLEYLEKRYKTTQKYDTLIFMDKIRLPNLLLICSDSSTKLDINAFLQSDFFILEASNFDEAINILSKKEIQFILIDTNTQKNIGISICKEIRRHRRFAYTPIILIIDNKDINLINEAIESGITNFLDKPITHESIKICLTISKYWSSLFQNMTTFSQGLKNIAEHDSLTSLYNRYFLFDHGRKEVAKSTRSKMPLSLLMIDLDKFKNVNDTYGHLAGDQILIQLSSLILQSSRSYDLAARYGGEEFILLLPGANQFQALIVAEKIRKNVENHNFKTHDGIEIKLTVSIGISTITDEISSLENLIEKADEALYQSKNNGRNQVTLI